MPDPRRRRHPQDVSPHARGIGGGVQSTCALSPRLPAPAPTTDTTNHRTSNDLFPCSTFPSLTPPPDTPFVAGSRKRQRNCWVAVVASAIATVSILPILTAPAELTPPPQLHHSSVSSSSTSIVVEVNGERLPSEPGRPTAAVSSESAEQVLLRQELAEPPRGRWRDADEARGGERLDAGGLSVGEEAAGGASSHGAGGDGAEEAAGSAARGAGFGGVSREGEGGKLLDGRDRCHVDDEGSHRCYPAVFFFGTSKCGETY